jgi:hypothetical protein
MHAPVMTFAASGFVAVLVIVVFIGSIIFQKIQEAEARSKRQSGAGDGRNTPQPQRRDDGVMGGLSSAELEAARRRREELRSRIQRGPAPATEVRTGTQSPPAAGSDHDRAREQYRQRAEQVRREREATTQQQNVSTGDRMRADATENARAASAAHDRAEAQEKVKAAADKERERMEEVARQKAASAPKVAGAAEPQPQSLLDSRQKKQVKPAATKPVRGFSLRQAMIWKEILDPPVSMRD